MLKREKNSLYDIRERIENIKSILIYLDTLSTRDENS